MQIVIFWLLSHHVARQSATRRRTLQQPGWDRLCWEFTVSERAVRQTSATRLCSSDGVSATHHPPTLEQPSGEALPAAGGRNWEVSGGDQWVVGGHCLPESIQRILWIDIELGKNILQCTDESIFLPTPSDNTRAAAPSKPNKAWSETNNTHIMTSIHYDMVYWQLSPQNVKRGASMWLWPSVWLVTGWGLRAQGLRL